MRVVLWSELFWPYLGGAELFSAQLMESLRARGYQFTVVTSHDYLQLDDDDSFRGIPIHRFPFRTALEPAHATEILPLQRRVVALLRTVRPHVIHLNGVSPSLFFCLQALKSEPIPLLIRLNQELRGSQGAPGTLFEHALRRAAWVTSVAAATLAQALAVLPDVRARSSVIYNGVDVASAPPPMSTAAAPRLLCVGRLVRPKGFDFAIDAFAAIATRWPTARLIIAGDGPERAALTAQAQVSGVADRIDFLGMVAPEAVSPLIAEASLVLIPSREEGLPNVALQGAAHARPIISTRTGGLPEVVRHEVTGLLVDTNSAALTAAISTLLEQPQLADRVRLAAWRLVRDVFDPIRCVDAYDRLYRQLAGIVD